MKKVWTEAELDATASFVCGDGLFDETKVKRNAAQCRNCGDVVESKYRHDFRRCSCGAIAVDGGGAYCRRLGNPEDFVELSEMKQ